MADVQQDMLQETSDVGQLKHGGEEPWLMMFHQLPPKPAYVRVKVWRRLQALGAISVKNSVYVLPVSDQAQEDLQWLLREIEQGGGTGSICEARFIDGLTTSNVREMFDAARDAEYVEIIKDLRKLMELIMPDVDLSGSDQRGSIQPQLVRIRRRLSEIASIDFFGAPGRREAEILLYRVEGSLVESVAVINEGCELMGRLLDRPDLTKVINRTWVTRRGIRVDRMASAWLISRFIDLEGQFKFVDAKDYTHASGELRFDMFEAEFTHEGSFCTFEVLLTYARLRGDGALMAIGELVHDIDMKDAKFGREETSGVALLLEGIVAREQADERRLERSRLIFDDLYESFKIRLSKKMA